MSATPQDAHSKRHEDVEHWARRSLSLEQEMAARDRALAMSEEQLQALLNAAADAIITIDQRGIIQSANAAAERIFGYAPVELLGQNVKILMPSPDHDRHDEYLATFLRTRRPRIIGIGREVWAQRKDGSVFPADLTVTEVDHLGLFLGIVRDISRRRQLEREVIEIASLEQRRISQDLHDSVGQELTALSMLSSDLVQLLRAEGSDHVDLAAKVVQGCQRTLEEVRTISRGLHPVPIDQQGLMTALADLAERLSNQTGVRCSFTAPQPVLVGNNVVATHLYYIAKEAATNALKHARPKRVEISLSVAPDRRVALAVVDDGRGLPDPLPVHAGLGLRIMSNRAQLIGAELTVKPGAERGTRVDCLMHLYPHVP